MSEKINSFRDLKIWQKGKLIAKLTYQLVELLPRNEEYSLSSQMKRASISIPANIAEGYRRRSRKEYQSYLQIALGSSAELETYIDLCKELHNINGSLSQDIAKELDEFQRMTSTIIAKLKA